VKRSMFKSFFYTDDKEKRVFIYYIIIIAVIAFIISLIVIITTLPKQEAAAPVVSNTPEKTEEPDSLATVDFMLPDTWKQTEELQSYSFHQVLPSWGSEQINHFWISPRKISIEILSKQNDTYIEELFADIP